MQQQTFSGNKNWFKENIALYIFAIYFLRYYNTAIESISQKIEVHLKILPNIVILCNLYSKPLTKLSTY